MVVGADGWRPDVRWRWWRRSPSYPAIPQRAKLVPFLGRKLALGGERWAQRGEEGGRAVVALSVLVHRRGAVAAAGVAACACSGRGN